MADLVIRGLSDAAIRRIDDAATARGLSREEYLRSRLELDGTVRPTVRGAVTMDDMRDAINRLAF